MYLGVSEVFMIASGKMIYTAHIYSCLKTLARVSVCAHLGKHLISVQQRAISGFQETQPQWTTCCIRRRRRRLQRQTQADTNGVSQGIAKGFEKAQICRGNLFVAVEEIVPTIPYDLYEGE